MWVHVQYTNLLCSIGLGRWWLLKWMLGSRWLLNFSRQMLQTQYQVPKWISCSMHNSHVLRTSVTFFLNPFRRLRSSCYASTFSYEASLYTLCEYNKHCTKYWSWMGYISACLKYLGKWLPKCIFAAHILYLDPGNKLGLTPVQGIDPYSGKNGKPQNSASTLGCNSTQVYTCNAISETHACTHSFTKAYMFI